MTVKPEDVGKRVRTDSGAEGWMYGHSLAPVAMIVGDDGSETHWRADKTDVVLNDSPVSMTEALHLRDVRSGALDRIGRFVKTLYGLPHRFADALQLHPYTVADALVDLTTAPELEPMAEWERDLLAQETP